MRPLLALTAGAIGAAALAACGTAMANSHGTTHHRRQDLGRRRLDGLLDAHVPTAASTPTAPTTRRRPPRRDAWSRTCRSPSRR